MSISIRRMSAALAVGLAATLLAAGCGPTTNGPIGVPAGAGTTASASASPSGTPATVASPIAPPPATTQAATTKTHAAPAGTTRTHAAGSGSCSSGEYRNSSGHCVPRPTHAAGAPAGASARCEDGTYSFSEHRSGTCSHHGGVAEWLKDLPA